MPAFMHFFGVFMQVHFEAKRYGLRGLTEDEMPKLRHLRERWPTLIPLVLLMGILVTGRTPYMAAFVGITSCAIVGLTTVPRHKPAGQWALMVALHLLLVAGVRRHRNERRIHPPGPVSWGPRRCGHAAAPLPKGALAPGPSSRRWKPAPSTRWRWARRRPWDRDRCGHADGRRLQAEHHHHRRGAGHGPGLQHRLILPAWLISGAGA